MKASDLVKLGTAFHRRKYDVVIVEVIGHDKHRSVDSLIVRDPNGDIRSADEHYLYPTMEIARSAIRDQATYDRDYHSARAAEAQAAIDRLSATEPSEDESEEPDTDVYEPDVGGEGGDAIAPTPVEAIEPVGAAP